MNGTNNQKEWSKGKCILLTSGLCTVALIPLFITQPLIGLTALGTLILVYAVSLGIFGKGFVVEGGVLVVIVAILITMLSGIINK